MDPCSFSQRRFFKAGGMGSYDPQIIKPPAVLLGGIRETVENIDGEVGGLESLRRWVIGTRYSPKCSYSIVLVRVCAVSYSRCVSDEV